MSGTECTGLSEILSGHADWNGLQCKVPDFSYNARGFGQ